MINKIIIDKKELKNYGSTENFAECARALLEQQKENWKLLNNGYESLEQTVVKEFNIDGSKVKAQLNPKRIASTSAKIDDKFIKKRECFLCVENLPVDQKGIQYGNDFIILCNPYPIFPEHFTIVKIEHKLQTIKSNFEDLLNLSKDLGKYYNVFYNGPKCGASAPDHLHFQSGLKNFIPIDYEYEKIIRERTLPVGENDKLRVYSSKNFLRKFFSFESSSKVELLNIFSIFYNTFTKISSIKEEPMMNILSLYQNNQWRIIIFPRQKHRPSFYFEAGDKKILLSPASVDLGGICITPREEDFHKVSKANLIDIFNQVCITTEFMEYLKKGCTRYFV